MKKVLTTLFLCCIAVMASGRGNYVPPIAYEWYPQYVTFLPEDKLDSVFEYAETDIVPIIFKVNKWDTEPGPQVDSICEIIEQVLNDRRVEMSYVWIGGSASPEGPIDNNKMLGRERAWVLAEYLLDNTDLSPGQVRVENLWEDWQSVERLLMRKRFPHRGRIVHIIQNEPDWQTRKDEIWAIDNGQTWRKLVEEVFPPFRNARMVIVCHANIHEDLLALESTPPFVAVCKPLITKKLNRVYFPEPSHSTRFFAFKTNLLFAAALTANLGIEVELWRQWSLDIPVWYSPYNITSTRKLRLLATQPELRWWTKKAGEGHFFGLHTHVVGFNVAINDHGRYQDPNHALWGLGIGYGYSTTFGKGKRWGLEFNIGVGFAEYEYNIYRNEPNGPLIGKGDGMYWGVTRAGITLSYRFYRPRKGRGILQW